MKKMYQIRVVTLSPKAIFLSARAMSCPIFPVGLKRKYKQHQRSPVSIRYRACAVFIYVHSKICVYTKISLHPSVLECMRVFLFAVSFPFRTCVYNDLHVYISLHS